MPDGFIAYAANKQLLPIQNINLKSQALIEMVAKAHTFMTKGCVPF